jgi:hypothetical protein
VTTCDVGVETRHVDMLSVDADVHAADADLLLAEADVHAADADVDAAEADVHLTDADVTVADADMDGTDGDVLGIHRALPPIHPRDRARRPRLPQPRLVMRPRQNNELVRNAARAELAGERDARVVEWIASARLDQERAPAGPLREATGVSPRRFARDRSLHPRPRAEAVGDAQEHFERDPPAVRAAPDARG